MTFATLNDDIKVTSDYYKLDILTEKETCLYTCIGIKEEEID